jgi:hypothetical protein
VKTITKHSGRIERRRAGDSLATLEAVCAQLWQQSCAEDGIPADSRCVVFSDTNKYAPFYDLAFAQLREVQAAYTAGGYIGLRIGG